MCATPLQRLRNIGIISHIDAGKTTVTERFLFYTGAIHRMGEVHEGQATTDWMSQERERGISITAAAITCQWRDHEVSIIDTPGHVDFTIEVERSLRVLDGAIAIFSAVDGVEPQSEAVWRQADKFHIPRLAFINKMDRVGADFFGTVEQMRKKLAAKPLLLQLPMGSGEEFLGVVDVLSGRALTWREEDLGGTVVEVDPPEEILPRVRRAREALVETLAEGDEALMESYLEGKPLEAAALREALRRAVLQVRVAPVLCGAAVRNKGIQPLLDAVVDLLPSPLDLPPAEGHHPDTGEVLSRGVRADEPTSAFVFKVQMDEGRRFTYLRVYSGRLRPGDVLLNATRGGEERIARLFRMFSHKRQRMEVVGPGAIVAATGIKGAATGDTLCHPAHPIRYEPIQSPHPVISVAIEPRTSAGQKRLEESLTKLADEDPTFRVRKDPETGQTLISGMGELHLDVLARRLTEEFRVEARVGRPRVIFRETLIRAAGGEGVFDRELGGKPQCARLSLRVAPTGPRGGVKFESALPEGALPPALVAAVERSVRSSAQGGPLAGYEMTDIAVTLLEADWDEARASEAAFSIAAGGAFDAACRESQAILLEPIMAVEVVSPEEFLGSVLGDLNARRGKVEWMGERGGGKVVQARVPLSRMFGYSTELRSLSQGRATFSMQFARYAPAEVEVA
ncbi:MAG: elongation factor G [Nitrospinota bacterium]